MKHFESMGSAAIEFFKADHFAIAGASDSPNKAGYMITNFYYKNSLPFTAINPSGKVISFPETEFKVTPIRNVMALEKPRSTALSVVTGPRVTEEVLRTAKDIGVTRVWLQPGTYDDSALAYARENFDVAVGGTDKPGTKGALGWCILMDGDDALKEARYKGFHNMEWK